MELKLKLILLLSAFFVGLGVGSWAVDAKYKKEELEQVKALKKALEDEQTRSEQISHDHAIIIQDLLAKAQARRGRVKDEVQKPSYRCLVPDSGWLLLDEAVSEANASR